MQYNDRLHCFCFILLENFIYAFQCEDINTEKADEISFTFYTAMAGMNIDVYLTLDGENAAKGAMMGQFPVEAKRK